MAQNLSQEVLDYINGICCPITYNFDVESSDWVGAGITDKSSFESAFGVTVSDFLISGNKIEAKILSTTSNEIYLNARKITSINYITIDGLTLIDLEDNNIANFNPTKPLPSTLISLNIPDNLLVSFNPTLPLPISLEVLSLFQNQMTTSGYTTSETWATNQPSFTNNCVVNLNQNINSVSGTNLETILTSKNCTIIP